jgi:hypothetical protein
MHRRAAGAGGDQQTPLQVQIALVRYLDAGVQAVDAPGQAAVAAF